MHHFLADETRIESGGHAERSVWWAGEQRVIWLSKPVTVEDLGRLMAQYGKTRKELTRATSYIYSKILLMLPLVPPYTLDRLKVCNCGESKY